MARMTITSKRLDAPDRPKNRVASTRLSDRARQKRWEVATRHFAVGRLEDFTIHRVGVGGRQRWTHKDGRIFKRLGSDPLLDSRPGDSGVEIVVDTGANTIAFLRPADGGARVESVRVATVHNYGRAIPVDNVPLENLSGAAARDLGMY